MKKVEKDMLLDMDSTITEVGCEVETMQLISEKLNLLCQDLDQIDFKTKNLSEKGIHHEEIHREVAILSKVMRHSMSDLKKHTEENSRLFDQVFDKVIREDEKTPLQTQESYDPMKDAETR